MKFFQVLGVCLLCSFIARAQTTAVQHKLGLKLGTVVNAETLFRSTDVDFGVSTGIHYQRRLSPSVYGGAKAQYFTLDDAQYFLLSPCLYTGLIEREDMKVMLISNLGYAFSDNQTENGMNWGGVNMGLGLENNYTLGKNRNMEFGVGLHYFLQERKYRTLLNLIDSDMKHVFGLSLYLVRRF